MPEFKVSKIKQVQAGEGPKGPWTKHKVRIETADGVKDVLLFCNQYSPVPAEGSTIEGEIGDPYKPGQLPEFKRARTGAYNGRGGAARDFKADPAKLDLERAKNRSIASEASQRVAVDTIRLAIEIGRDPADVAREIVAVARILYAEHVEVMGEAGK